MVALTFGDRNPNRNPRSLELGFEILTAHPCDRINRDTLGTNGFTFTVVRAVTKALSLHLLSHGQYPLLALWLALGQ